MYALIGKGKVVYEGGERYEGEFKGGMKHGGGELYFVNGDKFYGTWQNDRVTGPGTRIRIHTITTTHSRIRILARVCVA